MAIDSTGMRGGRPSLPEPIRRSAASLFRTKGFGSTTMRDISRAAGMPLGTVYYYIGNKQELLRTVCLETLVHIRQGGETAVQSVGDDPLEQIRTLIRSHMSLMLGEQDDHATVLLEIRSLDQSYTFEVLAARDAYEVLVHDVIERGQRAGVLRQDISVHTMTLLLLNLLNWTIFWYRPEGELSPDELSDSIIALFLDGAMTRQPTTARSASKQATAKSPAPVLAPAGESS